MTGPQGSGNHLFSKAFGINNSLWGWKSLQTTYWEGHDEEPFAECWNNPKLLTEFDWSQSKYFITSISSPYYYDGVETLPDYSMFHSYALDIGLNVKYVMIGRDQTILEIQQKSLRGRHTTPDFKTQLDFFLDKTVIYASQELLYLYGMSYLKNLEKQLDIPQSTNDDKLAEILQSDANKKYITQATSAVAKEVMFAMKNKRERI